MSPRPILSPVDFSYRLRFRNGVARSSEGQVEMDPNVDATKLRVGQRA